MSADDDLPVMSLWVQKLFGSSRFAACSGHAQGAYLLLLAREWGFRGQGLPSDDAALARLAGLTIEEWGRVRSEVLQFFAVRPDGRLANATCEEQIHEAARAKAAARERSERGNRARWGGQHPPSGDPPGTPQGILEGLPKESPPSPSPSEDEIPPLPPASGGGAGGILALARETLGLTPREAARLFRLHPGLNREDLEAWRALPARRPDLLEGVRSPRAYVRSLAYRYGTVAAAGASGEALKTPERAREEALARRAQETLREIQAPREVARPEEVRDLIASRWHRRRATPRE